VMQHQLKFQQKQCRLRLMQMQKHQNNCNGVALWCHFSKRTTRSRSIIELLMLWVKKTLQHSVTEEIGKKNMPNYLPR
jgi:hypothetical protein